MNNSESNILQQHENVHQIKIIYNKQMLIKHFMVYLYSSEMVAFLQSNLTSFSCKGTIFTNLISKWT
jgi:hypothetical protein